MKIRSMLSVLLKMTLIIFGVTNIQPIVAQDKAEQSNPL